MSVLNFYLTEDIVILATDTLAVHADTKSPYKFTNKVFPLMNMNSLICGVGNYECIVDWYTFCQKRAVGNGICHLNKVAEMYMKDVIGTQDTAESATVLYQFGISENDYKMHGYVYQSTNGFLPEKLDAGIGVRPTSAFGESGTVVLPESSYSSFEDYMFAISLQQKKYDDAQPIQSRVGIGGCVQIHKLTMDGLLVTNYKNFDDFDDCYEKILENNRRDT